MQQLSSKILKISLIVIVVLIGLQVMNQLLIYTGNKLFYLLPDEFRYKMLIVGIYQQSFQIITAILLSKLFLQRKISEIGVNFWSLRKSLQYFVIFIAAILFIYFLYLSLARLFLPELWLELKSAPIPTNQELMSKLIFQSIFPGLGEELLFRGFLVTLLISRVDISFSKFRNKFLVSVLSGLIFAVAHIYYDIFPFQVTHIDITQLLLALFSGTCYSLMYIKTKSLVAPILSHNFANLSSTIIGILLSNT